MITGLSSASFSRHFLPPVMGHQTLPSEHHTLLPIGPAPPGLAMIFGPRGQDETYAGRQRRVCSLTQDGQEAFRAAGRVWEKMLPEVQRTVAQALAPTVENPELMAVQQK